VKVLAIHHTPKVAPHMIEKKIVTPYEVAGIQKATHDNPQTNVITAAMSILSNRSLKIPIIGLPITVPKFKNPAILVV
jgi:hypothetical protein